MLIISPGCWFSVHRPQPERGIRRALFLDRDGVIIPDRPYRRDAVDLELMDGAANLIGRASHKGMAVIVVTNQSGIGRGYFTWSEFADINTCMIEMLRAAGAPVDAVLAAGWHRAAHEGEFPISQSHWRKPAPGMFLAAASKLNIDLSRSCMIGDNQSDMGAARAARVRMGLLLSDQIFENCEPDDGFEQHSVANLRECLPYITG